MRDWQIDGNKVKLLDAEFYRQCSCGCVAELQDLIDRGANPNAPIYFVPTIDDGLKEDFYAIHEAATNPDIEVLKYVISLGVNPCTMDFWAREPLSYAVERNALTVVKYLVDCGNNPANCDHDGGTVLSDSALNPDIEVCKYLLSKGAEIESGACDLTELCRALSDGTIERMKFFMDLGGDLANAMNHRAYRAPLENIRFALESGYDPNSIDWTGREKVIDSLDAARQALFRGFGGIVSH